MHIISHFFPKEIPALTCSISLSFRHTCLCKGNVYWYWGNILESFTAMHNILLCTSNVIGITLLINYKAISDYILYNDWIKYSLFRMQKEKVDISPFSQGKARVISLDECAWPGASSWAPCQALQPPLCSTWLWHIQGKHSP